MTNGLLMQYFEWHVADDGKHWEKLKNEAAHLKEIGVTAVWLPPCSKGTGSSDVGYGVYDLYDLGEFDQKGTVRTKYGTKTELLEAIQALHDQEIQVYADLVLNHRGGADKTERFTVVEVNPNNRQEVISEPHEIEGWTNFTFPGRQNRYSDFKWHWYHFSGIDFNNENGETGIYMIQGEGKGWADDETVDNEKGNYDYLMNADIDYSHPEVMEETKKWLSWFIKETQIDGARLDAVKHIDGQAMKELTNYVRQEFGEEFYFVGEYWNPDLNQLENYLDLTDGQIDVFDVQLHNNLHEASVNGSNYDLRRLQDGSLVQQNATYAVTFVDNHDSQPGEALESFVDEWFKPHAYAFILLREAGFPTLFYGDYYGIEGQSGHALLLDHLATLRKNYAYGQQDDYLDHPNCIGWVRQGNEDHPDGCAVLLSNGEAGNKRMFVGQERAGQSWVNCLDQSDYEIVIDPEGFADFTVPAGAVAVWLPKGTA